MRGGSIYVPRSIGSYRARHVFSELFEENSGCAQRPEGECLCWSLRRVNVAMFHCRARTDHLSRTLDVLHLHHVGRDHSIFDHGHRRHILCSAQSVTHVASRVLP